MKFQVSISIFFILLLWVGTYNTMSIYFYLSDLNLSPPLRKLIDMTILSHYSIHGYLV